MKPKITREPESALLKSIGIGLVLFAILAFSLALYTLFIEQKPALELEGYADSDLESYEIANNMGIAMLNYYLSMFLKPLIFALIGLVILIAGLVLCRISRPKVQIRVLRPIHVRRPVTGGSSDENAIPKSVSTFDIRSLPGVLNFSIGQWVLVGVAVFCLFAYMPLAAGLCIGLVVCMIWYNTGFGKVVVEDVLAESEGGGEAEEEEASPTADDE